MSAKEGKLPAWKTAIVFALLVVFPAISWYYLRGGVQWRKAALSELKTYGKIRPSYLILPNGEQIDELKGKVCVVHLFGDNPDLTDANRKILDTYVELAGQFGDHDAYRNVPVWEGGTDAFKKYWHQIPNNDRGPWNYAAGIGGWKTVLVNQYEYFCLGEKVAPVPEYFALSDTTGTIRRFYNALDKGQVERMIQHVAILLPVQK